MVALGTGVATGVGAGVGGGVRLGVGVVIGVVTGVALGSVAGVSDGVAVGAIVVGAGVGAPAGEGPGVAESAAVGAVVGSGAGVTTAAVTCCTGGGVVSFSVTTVWVFGDTGDAVDVGTGVAGGGYDACGADGAIVRVGGVTATRDVSPQAARTIASETTARRIWMGIDIYFEMIKSSVGLAASLNDRLVKVTVFVAA